jgi:hypothetical protein
MKKTFDIVLLISNALSVASAVIQIAAQLSEVANYAAGCAS